MYLCERCAIMVASRGFEISKMIEKKVKKQELVGGDFKTLINSTFNSIKNTKHMTFDTLNSFETKLQSKEKEIENYFDSLN